MDSPNRVQPSFRYFILAGFFKMECFGQGSTAFACSLNHKLSRTDHFAHASQPNFGDN